MTIKNWNSEFLLVTRKTQFFVQDTNHLNTGSVTHRWCRLTKPLSIESMTFPGLKGEE